ncbi:H-2 class I histocompatibility antigen, Q9 alpha chain [Pimephales promelas]|uniref:H-2 class I histocompatibility antigen, Q9 alpha chain n=1 Tax=Pimephales promelas TaxID=90988 RepID=UPI001955AE7A|nr:H-2 class I histocompatibility antigen, Q9 alpha chain [Pimephales promelas]KAG1948513.1 major histocompatibility complex class I-related protein [Pimephales promelas]
MRSVVLLLLGVHLAYAGTHSLKYVYTAVSGDIDFPEFTAVGLVDDVQIDYFDSNTMKDEPKTEWMRQSEGADYWDSQTQTLIGTHQSFKNNIQVAKERFNQSKGVHTFQFMYGCELDDDSTRVHWQYGYDGEDFISFDKDTLIWTAAKPQAFITKTKWDEDKANNKYQKSYLETECIEWLKKYVGYGKDTLERKDAPKVFLLQKDPSSPVLCQATGFYPSNIMMTWQKNEEDHYEDVAVGTTLPNIDGTFQKTITLKHEDWKNDKEAYRCVVQHVGAAKDIIVTVHDIRSNTGSDYTIAIVVGCLVGVAVLAAIVGLVFWKKSNGYGRTSTKDSDSENSAQPLPQLTTK